MTWKCWKTLALLSVLNPISMQDSSASIGFKWLKCNVVHHKAAKCAISLLVAIILVHTGCSGHITNSGFLLRLHSSHCASYFYCQSFFLKLACGNRYRATPTITTAIRIARPHSYLCNRVLYTGTRQPPIPYVRYWIIFFCFTSCWSVWHWYLIPFYPLWAWA